ncbi:DUF4282 domain-containing protein [bacterium]|nr:DUF4282 domain-containing protein [bacterium]
MAEQRWMVTMDGKQLENDMSVQEVRTLINNNPGKQILVWTQGLTQWMDASTVPEFRKMAPAKPVESPKAEPVIKTSSDELKEKAGLLKGLLDFRFEHFITTKIISILYIIVIVLIALGGLFYFFVGGGMALWAGIQARSFFSILIALGIMILTPIVMVLYLAAIRMWFEIVIIFFRIKEDLSKLVERSESKVEVAKK